MYKFPQNYRFEGQFKDLQIDGQLKHQPIDS
jgi:hypothetical protein